MLVVGIVVDQLRTDYIEGLQSRFSEHGFRYLIKDGVYFRDVDFKVSPLDAASATAMLYTGSYPAQTGVPSASVFEQTSSGPVSRPALASAGTVSNDSFTPENLRLSTVADEVAIDGVGLGAVYSIATEPQQAVIMAGHAAKNAVWLNNTTGNWATSSYYGSLPVPVSNRNFRASLSSRLDTMQWRPLLPLDGVQGISDIKLKHPFRHQFVRADRDVYRKFSSSALANAEVTDLAIEFIRQLKMGGGPALDMLSLGYTAAPFKYVADTDFRAELADSYIRLDRQLGRLFEAIDRYVGADNALIFISSTGYYDDAVVEEKKYRIPGGEFSTKRAKSLLNSYLSAKHGSAGYVEAIRDRHVFLDHKAIEARKLDPEAIARDARTFLAKMSGVAEVYTVSDILSPATPEQESMRLALDPRFAGDLIVNYAPGWDVVDDEEFPPVNRSMRSSPVASPAFLIGAGLAPAVISTPVDATVIAPTVTGLLRIRSPNGSEGRPMQLDRKE